MRNDMDNVWIGEEGGMAFVTVMDTQNGLCSLIRGKDIFQTSINGVMYTLLLLRHTKLLQVAEDVLLQAPQFIGFSVSISRQVDMANKDLFMVAPTAYLTSFSVRNRRTEFLANYHVRNKRGFIIVK